MNFEVTFSQPVTGVDIEDFRLDIEKLSGATISEVVGSGDIYNVSVNTGSKSGSVRLDLIDDDSIKGLDGVSLGLAGVRNGNFVSGEVYIIDRTAPDVSSISMLDLTINSARYVKFLVSFSEPVVGVNSDDFSLETIGLTKTAIIQVSGSGNDYIITIDTGIGAGTLALRLIDDDSILDIANNPLGGDGLSNGNFLNSEFYKIRIQSFVDVPITAWSWYWIERVFDAGITSGCEQNPLKYCPEKPVTRAEMAVFLEKGINGAEFTPQPGSGNIFLDVTKNVWYLNWVEQLFKDQITQGCAVIPPLYCPEKPVTRAQMAIFLLKAKYGADYFPLWDNEASGFTDVSKTDPAAPWIWQLASEGITSGCGDGKFCPTNAVTREQMAAFLVRIFLEP